MRNENAFIVGTTDTRCMCEAHSPTSTAVPAIRSYVLSSHVDQCVSELNRHILVV